MKSGNEIKKFEDAARGVGFFFRFGQHAKFHLVVAIFTVIAGFFFGITNAEWAAVILCICAVLVAEALNTAIEMICDFVHAEHHPEIGKIKDIAAGAVLLAAIAAAITGCIIFIPYIIKL